MVDLKGRTCDLCGKGKYAPFKDEVSAGIYVDADKCDNCGEIAYSLEVMRKVNAMHRAESQARKLVKIGSSIAALIPADIVKKLQLKAKEKVYISTRNNEIIIKPSLI